jgi:hypothetical protein
MIDLRNDEQRFDNEFPAYGNARYAGIAACVAALPTARDLRDLLASACGRRVLDLLRTLLEIRNYKAQVPFPRNPAGVLHAIATLKDLGAPRDDDDAFGPRRQDVFERLVGFDGFELPTVSAVFHFCFPDRYPIVDRNIETACKALCNGLDTGEPPPALPAYAASAERKWTAYRTFAHCLQRIRQAHNARYGTTYDFRALDRALMVYGAARRRQREAD